MPRALARPPPFAPLGPSAPSLTEDHRLQAARRPLSPAPATAGDDLTPVRGENPQRLHKLVAAGLVGPGEKGAAFEGVRRKQFRDSPRSAAVYVIDRRFR